MRPGLWGSAAAVLLCAGAAAGLHAADLRRGPVPALAERFAEVTAEVEITSDPRLARPRINGDHIAPTALMFDADVTRVTQADGTVLATRTPVLVIVDARSRRDAPRESGGRSPWLSLLPSTRLRVAARVVPALSDGKDIAAVLRVRGSAAPAVVGAPSGPQRFAGRLREGLRKATDGLDADARALLPGLVVGDTSRRSWTTPSRPPTSRTSSRSVGAISSSSSRCSPGHPASPNGRSAGASPRGSGFR